MRISRKNPDLNELIELLDEKYVAAGSDTARAWDAVAPDELAYINEEIDKCVGDCRYYLENYHTIRDEHGRLKTLYPFWDHQEIIYNFFEEDWAKQGCFRAVILKPRQSGGTTWSSGFIFHGTIFTPEAYSLTMAQDEKVSGEIFQRLMDAYHNLPWWLRPEYVSKQQGLHVIFQRRDEAERLVNPGLGSTLLVSNAQRSSGIAIGRTIRNLHGSEVSRWPSADAWTADIKPSLNAHDMKAILESTAWGRNGLFFNMWRAAEQGKSNWRPIFIPVYKVRKYFIPLRAGESFDLTLEEKALRKSVKEKENFTIPYGFFKWRRQDIIETINATGSDETHDEAYPVTSSAAFLSSGFGAFPKKCLNEQDKNNCCPPIWIGEIEYNGPDGEPILRGHKPQPEELLEKPDRFNRLWVWEWPDANDVVEYYGAADVSGGAGPDFSDGVFYRLGFGPEPHVQVAEWHGLCNPSHFAKILAALGYYYHTAELAVEYMKAGVTTGDELLWQLDYPNLYRWKHLDKINNSLTMHVHWMTTSRTRDDAINRMNEALLDNTIIIRNHHTIEEMRDFGRLEGDGKAAGLDNEDDAVMANIIAICAAHQSGKRTQDFTSSGSASHLMPRGPQLFGLYDHLNRQLGQFDGLDQALTFLRKMEKEHAAKLEEIPSLIAAPPLTCSRAKGMDASAQEINPQKPWAKDSSRYVLRLPDGSILVTLREIMVMKANTPWSPVHDAQGAERELHYKHGVPVRSITPDIVHTYREMLTTRYYSGEDN
jgi:hypothetical protein